MLISEEVLSITAVEPPEFPYFDYRRYTFSLGIKAGAGVWLAGNTASRFDPDRGRMVIDGDVEAQSRLAHDKITTILGAAGLSTASVIKMTDYVTPAGLDGYGAVDDFRREIFRGRLPAQTTVVVKRLLRAQAQIEIEAVASAADSWPVGPSWPEQGVRSAAVRTSDGLVYVSGQIGVDPDTGEVVGQGDVVVQLNQIFRNAGHILERAGLGLEQVVKTVEFLVPTARGRYDEIREVRGEFLKPPYPVSTGVISPKLPHPEALIQVDFVASRMPKHLIDPGWKGHERRTYSPGVRTGPYLFISSVGALDPGSGDLVHRGDVVAQTRQVFKVIGEVLQASGLRPASVVKTIDYISADALPDYPATAGVRQEFFTPPYPAATGVVVEDLLQEGMLINVESVAVME